MNFLDVPHLAEQYELPWEPNRFSGATDLPGPPPDPRAVALALIMVLGLVVGAHRLELFRVPAWELPPSLHLRSAGLSHPLADPVPGSELVRTER